MQRSCTCGAPARIRFSRVVPSGRWVREDRCDDCAMDLLRAINDGPATAWQVADITDTLLAEHSRIDARNRRGDADTDLMLFAFGSDY